MTELVDVRAEEIAEKLAEGAREAIDLGDWFSAGYNVRLLLRQGEHLNDLLNAVNEIERDRAARDLRVEREQGG